MTDTLPFTTEIPTESFDDLSPDPFMPAFSSDLGSEKQSDRRAPITLMDPAEEMECRIALLEVAFQNHALEIRDRMAARIQELENRLKTQNGEFRRILQEEKTKRHEEFRELSSSVTNAIDRVESATCAAKG